MSKKLASVLHVAIADVRTPLLAVEASDVYTQRPDTWKDAVPVLVNPAGNMHAFWVGKGQGGILFLPAFKDNLAVLVALLGLPLKQVLADVREAATTPVISEAAAARRALEEGQAGERGAKKMDRREASARAWRLLRENPKMGARELAKAIPCALGMVSKLPAWRATQEQLLKGKTPKLKAVSLTPELQACLGEDVETVESLTEDQRKDEAVDEYKRFVPRRQP